MRISPVLIGHQAVWQSKLCWKTSFQQLLTPSYHLLTEENGSTFIWRCAEFPKPAGPNKFLGTPAFGEELPIGRFPHFETILGTRHHVATAIQRQQEKVNGVDNKCWKGPNNGWSSAHRKKKKHWNIWDKSARTSDFRFLVAICGSSHIFPL